MKKGNDMKTVDQAKKLIKEEMKKREELCAKEINDVLKKHNCQAIIEGQFSGNQIQTGLKIQAL